MHTGKLYLFPVDIGNKDLNTSIPAFNNLKLHDIAVFGCENIKSARRFLINAGISSPIPKHIEIIEIRNDEANGYEHLIAAMKTGKDVGYMSEAGNPCIADPGERLVSMAHNAQLDIIPLVGPSSILLALIASGLNGESFSFNGYLDRDQSKRHSDIKRLIKQADSGFTQIFMETPYRNNAMMMDLLKHCPGSMKLCIACNINTDEAYIKTRMISDWYKNKPDLNKKPTIFVLGNNY